MTRPIEAITNAETGQTIYQEMGDVEYAIYLADREAEAQAVIQKAQEEADALAAKTAAEARLAALGLTTDDLKALGLGTN